MRIRYPHGLAGLCRDSTWVTDEIVSSTGVDTVLPRLISAYFKRLQYPGVVGLIERLLNCLLEWERTDVPWGS